MSNRRYEFKLIGETPLLMHADDILAGDELSAWRKDPANKGVSTPGDDRSPAWTWQTYLYLNDRKVSLPSANLSVCLRQAATQIIMKKQKTFKEASQSGMLIETEFVKFTISGKTITEESLPHRDVDFTGQANAVRGSGFKLFAKRAKIGQASKHIRVRPRFDKWEVSGAFSVMLPELTEEILQQMFQLAGRIGLGDWRPGCKTPGPFGMFRSELKAD